MPLFSKAYGPVMPPAPTSFRFQETADFEKGFEVYFEDKIKPILKELDQEKMKDLETLEKSRPKANLIFWGGLAVGVAMTIVSRNLIFLLFIGIAVWGIKGMILATPGNSLAGKYKSKIIPLVIQFFGDFQYKERMVLDGDLLTKSALFEGFNRSAGEDAVMGVYHGTKFSFVEANLEYHSSGRHGGTSTIFKGMILTLELKNFCQGKTILKRESQKGLWAWLTGRSAGLKNFKLNNADLENIFEAYTSNESEAQSLLNPDFLACLMKINEVYSVGGVRCAFFENTLLLAISYRTDEVAGKMFESLTARKLELNVEELHLFLAQIHGVLEIIDTIIPRPRDF